MSAEDVSHGMSLREILTVLFKRKWFILAALVLILGGVAVGVAMAPREYEASAMLMLTRARADLTVTPFETSPGAVALRLNPSQDLVSESELLKRRSLLMHVVQTLGSETTLRGRLRPPEDVNSGEVDAGIFGKMRDLVVFARPAVAAPARLLSALNGKEPLTRADQAIQAVGRRLKVSAIDNTNLIRLSFNANDAEYASKVLGILMDQYMDQYVRLRTNPGAAEFFETQVTSLSKELREAEDAREALDQKYGVRRLDAQTDIYLRNISEMEGQYQASRSEMEGLREKARVLRDEIDKLPDKVRGSEEVRANPVVDSMRTRLMDLELQRNKMLQLYTDQDRRVQDVEREIALLRQRLAAEPNVEFARESYGPNPNRTPLNLELVNTETQLVAATVKTKNLEHDLQTAESRLDKVTKATYDRQRLDRKVKMLEENYLIYAKKYEEARISSAMDKNRIVNISVVEPVAIAPKPGVGGRSALDLALIGAVFGLVIGVGGAFGREYLDSTFSSTESARRQLNLPVLGSIPEDRK
jgi:uncharacterized protein involved in exopolysaccharide biosynthesis